ncbi:MAG TPA: phosphoribosyltransferase family protein [Hyphomicrobiaceae bacterium]|nr:phosphoribosyltransferase family protein [Hyphomicrobiaceae bacterium]
MRRRIFADRAEAGQLLGERLAQMQLAHPVVLALPRGGVPVAAQIAARLHAPLDVIFVRKLGAPEQPELAVGAVADGSDPEIVLNSQVVAMLDLDQDYIASTARRELAVIERRRQEWAPLRPVIDAAGHTVIVVDDGVATGMTMQAALRQQARRQPSRLIAAAPVASRQAVAMLRREADELVCLRSPRNFGSVGAFYQCFVQVTDDEVAALLRSQPQALDAGS